MPRACLADARAMPPKIPRRSRVHLPHHTRPAKAPKSQSLLRSVSAISASPGRILLRLGRPLRPCFPGRSTGQRRAERELQRFRLVSAARPTGSARKFDRYERGLERSLTRALSQLRELQSQRREMVSPDVETVSPNVVQMGYVSLQTPEKQG